MMFKQIIQPIGGINRDDDPRYLQEGDYLDLLNARVGSNQEQSTRGLVESFLSHFEITLSESTLTILGVAENEENNEAFILAHQENLGRYFFQIYKFNILTDAVLKIYQATARSADVVWFLPSRFELSAMYDNLHSGGIGDFQDTPYWSSTEMTTTSARAMHFNTGVSSNYSKSSDVRARACRTFIALSGSYSIQDVGPQGGWIFHIIDEGATSVYYEAAEKDIPVGKWSDILDEMIGTTSDAIGAGQANTLAIINQLNHTTSAAQKALDFPVASVWNITDQTKIYNPCILDRKLVWTDNVNPIMYVDVDRVEMSYINNIGGDLYRGKFEIDQTYFVGETVFDIDSYWKCVVQVYGLAPPHDFYWERICYALEAYEYLHTPDIFNLVAQPPLLAAIPEYRSDLARKTNNLLRQTFQFSYRYVYIDYRKSTYAPPSIVPPPHMQETEEGILVEEQSYHNMIEIRVNTGPAEVRAIEIIGRSSDDPAAWFVVEEVQLYNRKKEKVIDTESVHTISWYNDAIKVIADIREVSTLFTFIPVRSKHLEVIEGNRISVANITEGYDRIAPDVRFEVSYEDLAGRNKYVLSCEPVFTKTRSGNIYHYQLKITLPPEPIYGLYSLRVVNPDNVIYDIEIPYGTAPGTTTSAPEAYPQDLKDLIIAEMEGHTPAWAQIDTRNGTPPAYADPNPYEIWVFWDSVEDHENPFKGWQYKNLSQVTIEGASFYAVNKYPHLKEGAQHGWGIIYRDEAGRISPIVAGDELTEYLPLPMELGEGLNRGAVVDFYINHLPPDWAESYEIVYSGNKTVSWFLQLIAENIQYGKRDHDDQEWSGNTDTRYLRISLEDMYARTREKLPSWSVEQYIWTPGDRIRIIGKYKDQSVTVHTGVYDREILGIFTDKDYIGPVATTTPEPGKEAYILRDFLYFQDDGTFAFITDPSSDAWDDVFVEIYRPYKEIQTTFYFTTGMTFPVRRNVLGHKYHTGSIQDQELNTDGESVVEAGVRNTAHDVWKYQRHFADKDEVIQSVWAESMYSSDYYIAQKLTSSGVPIPDLDNYAQTKLTKRLRHGGRLNFGTELNNIAKFDYNDFQDMKDEHGPIESIIETGFILKVIQYNKISSIFISRIETYSPKGEPQYMFTDKVFGSMRPELHKWGTSHPESVIVHGNYIYFWDQAEGVVIRDAMNGAHPISEYKMFRYFKDKAREIDSYENPEVTFMFNAADNMLMCTFGDGTNFETIAFAEGENRWKFRTDAKIRKPFWIGKRLYHIYGGKIYQWWRDEQQGYLELSGEQKTWHLIGVANEHPMKVKHFNALAVYQEGDIPDAELKVPKEVSATGRDMESIVGSSTWEQKEGVWYGPILRDKNTPNLTGDNNKYMNGVRLRGQYCEVKLKGDKTDGPVRLFNIMVSATPSERSM